MEGMIGEIRMFGGNFAPRAWAFCDGQILAIATNTALFSILGTIYGGDGRTTFALPDIRGRCVIGPGNGPGLPSYREGEKGGSETNTMTVSNMPSHNHSVQVHVAAGSSLSNDPTNAIYGPMSGRTTGSPPENINVVAYSDSSDSNMAADMVTLNNNGGSQSINDMMPYSVVNYVICMQGVFPSRG